MPIKKNKLNDPDSEDSDSDPDYDPNDPNDPNAYESDTVGEEELSGGEPEDDEGGDGNDDKNELSDDSATIEPDPEDDVENEDKYDPIADLSEPEDRDEEIMDDADIDADIDADVDVDVDADIDVDIDMDIGVEDGYAESKPCHLKNINKDILVLDEDDSNMYGKMEYKRVDDADRETDEILTYYETVRIIGTRAQQFNFGAEPLVSGLEGLHPAKMAYIELMAKMTPYIIRRHLPGKKYEEWRIDELKIIHEIKDDFFLPENFDWDALMSQSRKYSELAIKANEPKKPLAKNAARIKKN